MPLYRISSGDLEVQRVHRIELASEQELHTLIEKNLETLLGIRFVANEYQIPNGRIDTLGLDEDGTPVIIEYKKRRDLSATVQGLFYLDWVMQNRRPFESIVKDKVGKDVDVNWSTQPRLLIIAEEFDIKELAAINQMGPQIELIKYAAYEDLFNIERVNIIDSKPLSAQRSASELQEGRTIEQLASRTSDDVREVFLELRERVLGLSESVWEKVFEHAVDYRTVSTFAEVSVQKTRLRIVIKMGDRKLDDPRGICRPIPKSHGWGHLNTRFELSDDRDVDYAMQLISQAHDFVSG